MKNAAGKVKLVICGTDGRMGSRIVALAKADPQFEIVAGVNRGDDMSKVLSRADAVIDFTNAEATLANASKVAKSGRGLVIGTTGFKPAQLSKLKELGRRIPVVFSPNMSVGVNALFEILKEAASKLAHYDIEIVEAHHNQKKDAPSGTAMRLAEIAADASKRSSKDFVYGRQGLVGARTKKEIGILAVRAGDIVGDHTIYLSGPGERLELTHRAHSRDAFAAGALTAAAWVKGHKPGFYSMLDVLK